jgi:hypothetical protein
LGGSQAPRRRLLGPARPSPVGCAGPSGDADALPNYATAAGSTRRSGTRLTTSRTRGVCAGCPVARTAATTRSRRAPSAFGARAAPPASGRAWISAERPSRPRPRRQTACPPRVLATCRGRLPAGRTAVCLVQYLRWPVVCTTPQRAIFSGGRLSSRRASCSSRRSHNARQASGGPGPTGCPSSGGRIAPRCGPCSAR